MNISLRRGEKLYLNGAVIRVDRKVSLELLNDVTFLLENHVMQEAEANTPLRRIYFVVQLMIMSPNDADATLSLCKELLGASAKCSDVPAIRMGLATITKLIEHKKLFDALKTLRKLFEYETVDKNGAPPALQASA